eukprot:2207781-Amphidinium_carterae.1
MNLDSLAVIAKWARSVIGSVYQRADGGKDCVAEQSEASACIVSEGSVRSGCQTLRECAKVACLARNEAIAKRRCVRRERAALRRDSAAYAPYWRRAVRINRAAGGLMLGQKALSSLAASPRECDLDRDLALMEPPGSGGVLQQIPVLPMASLPSVDATHCLGDGNCLWRALSKACRRKGKEVGWKRLKARVISSAKREFPSVMQQWDLLAQWGVPADALALQAAAVHLNVAICLDWQGRGFCFNGGDNNMDDLEKDNLWLRLRDHHFECVLPRSGPLQALVCSEEEEKPLSACVGGASHVGVKIPCFVGSRSSREKNGVFEPRAARSGKNQINIYKTSAPGQRQEIKTREESTDQSSAHVSEESIDHKGVQESLDHPSPLHSGSVSSAPTVLAAVSAVTTRSFRAESTCIGLRRSYSDAWQEVRTAADGSESAVGGGVFSRCFGGGKRARDLSVKKTEKSELLVEPFATFDAVHSNHGLVRNGFERPVGFTNEEVHERTTR